MNPQLREALRRVDEGKVDDLSRSEVGALQAHGMLKKGKMTKKGEKELERILASGDGPEALKELLRPPRR